MKWLKLQCVKSIGIHDNIVMIQISFVHLESSSVTQPGNVYQMDLCVMGLQTALMEVMNTFAVRFT